MKLENNMVEVDTSKLGGVKAIIDTLGKQLITKDTAVELITEMVYGTSHRVGVEQTQEGYRWTEECKECESFNGNNCIRPICIHLDVDDYRPSCQETLYRVSVEDLEYVLNDKCLEITEENKYKLIDYLQKEMILPWYDTITEYVNLALKNGLIRRATGEYDDEYNNGIPLFEDEPKQRREILRDQLQQAKSFCVTSGLDLTDVMDKIADEIDCLVEVYRL
jgi:hypothetical protein